MSSTNQHQRVETLLDVYGAYHLARILADPELADLGPPFAEAQSLLAERAQQYRLAQIALMQAMGRLDARRDPGSATGQSLVESSEEVRCAIVQCEAAQQRAADAFELLERQKALWFQAYRESYRKIQIRHYRKGTKAGLLRLDPVMVDAGVFHPLDCSEIRTGAEVV